MIALVLHQMGALAEALPAVLALVRPLTRVDALVLDEVGAAAEALATVSTHVGLLPGVDPLVADQVGAAVEALPALDADVGLLSHECSLMHHCLLPLPKATARILLCPSLWTEVWPRTRHFPVAAWRRSFPHEKV